MNSRVGSTRIIGPLSWETCETLSLTPSGPAPERRAAKQWTVLWMLAIHSGLREGELLALTWSDVDLERRTLTVHRDLVTVKDQTPRFGEPKSQTSRRTVSLPTEAVQALCQHKAGKMKVVSLPSTGRTTT